MQLVQTSTLGVHRCMQLKYRFSTIMLLASGIQQSAISIVNTQGIKANAVN